MSNAHNNPHSHPHPTIQPIEVSQHSHDTHNGTPPYPVVQESSQYTHDTHKNTHPHPSVQPIEVSQYTYDAHKPSYELASTHDQTLRQHSVASPPQPTSSRIHPVETEHPHLQDNKKHDKHDSKQHHPEHPKPHHQPEPEHAHKLEHTHEHEHQHHSPSLPTSTIESDSVQVSPVFGNAERRQSWSKDEMKRGVMEGLLEKGKGKQAKGGYSSTS